MSNSCWSDVTGVIWRATDTVTKSDFALKLEDVRATHPSLRKEYDLYRELGKPPHRVLGIPHVYWFFHIHCYLGIEMQILGPSVEDVKEATPLKRVDLQDALMLASHIVCFLAIAPATMLTILFGRY
jgi:hypothetical protein